MKKFIKKNVSVILSVALILGMMLPAFSGVVANAYTAENTVIKSNIDAACDTLIAEWNKLIVTDGLQELTPYELSTEAAALDLSSFANTSAFVSARQNLAALLVNSFDSTELKTAWGNMYRVVGADFYAPFAVTGEGVSDAFYLKSNNSNVTVNTVSEAEKHIFGVKSATFDYSVGVNRTGVTGTTEYEIFLSNDPEKIEDADLAANYSKVNKLYGADDLQFSFVVNEINTAATGAKMGFKVSASINGNFSVLKSSYYIDINEDMMGEIQTVRFSDIVAGISKLDENWLEAFQTTSSISRIELQLCDADSAENAAINMTLGSDVAINYSDVPTAEETESWNVSDWVYATKSVDIAEAYNAAAFETAIRNAEELKEISGVEMSNTVTTHNDVSGITLPEKNLLEGIIPSAHYYDGVSNSKEERFTTEFKKLADGSLSRTVAIESGNFENQGAFLELVYDLGATCAVEKMAVVSAYEEQLRNYKYKIYAAKTESDLFTNESAVKTYTNRDSSMSQIYDYSGGPELLAKYIAIRVYIPVSDMENFDGAVRFNELGVYGTIKDYTVSASEFSANAISALGKNILNFNTTKAFVRADTGNRQRFDSLFDSEKYPISNLYDADINTQVAIGGNYRMYYDGDTTSLHIYYDLGKTYAIDKFLYSSMAGTFVETGKYRIHASNDLNKLFNGKSVVVDYDNTVNATRMQIFSMNNVVNARYVSFEVTLPLADYKGWLARNAALPAKARQYVSVSWAFSAENT